MVHESGRSAWERMEPPFADPPVVRLGRCARVATSGLRARTVRRNRRDSRDTGTPGRGSWVDHARTAGGAVRDAADIARRGRGGADRHARRRARRGRYGSDGGGEFGAAASRGTCRARQDQRDPGLALPGRARAARRGSHPRPDGAAGLRGADPRAGCCRRAAGPPQIRNAGTLGGNIVTAAPTGDALPVLAALEATLVVAGPDGARRETPVSHLLAGRDMLQPAELVGFVRVPLLHAPRSSSKPPAVPAPAGRPPRSPWSSTRPGAGCAARSAPSRRCRCARSKPSAGSPR